MTLPPRMGQLTWQMLELALQIFATQGPLLAPVTSKYVQFSELVPPHPTVTVKSNNYIQNFL